MRTSIETSTIMGLNQAGLAGLEVILVLNPGVYQESCRSAIDHRTWTASRG